MAKEQDASANDAKTQNEAAGITAEYFAEQGAKSADNRSKGGEDVKLSLTNKTTVRFTKDFGKHLKKGDVMEISDQAVAIYMSKGVIEKL